MQIIENTDFNSSEKFVCSARALDDCESQFISEHGKRLVRSFIVWFHLTKFEHSPVRIALIHAHIEENDH